MPFTELENSSTEKGETVNAKGEVMRKMFEEERKVGNAKRGEKTRNDEKDEFEGLTRREKEEEMMRKLHECKLTVEAVNIAGKNKPGLISNINITGKLSLPPKSNAKFASQNLTIPMKLSLE